MFKISRNSRGLSANGGNPPSRWYSVFIALMLALSIGSAGQSPLAQAAPNNQANVEFEVGAYPDTPSPLPLCPKEHLKIYVSVSRSIHRTINGTDRLLYDGLISGVDVRGSMTNNIGKLTPPDTSPVQPIDFRQGNADFLFTASKVGTTTLIFNADVPGAWTGSAEALALGRTYPARKAEIKIEVRNCKFRAKTVSIYKNDFYSYVGQTEAEVRVDDQGRLTGSSIANWVAVFSNDPMSPCGMTKVVVAPSPTEWSGEMDDKGQLMATLTFQPATTNVSATCLDASGSKTFQLTHDPLTISVPSSGGVITQVTKIGGVPGTATIIVIPEEEEAVAFNTDSRAALSPSAWWVMLWDDFPWAYNALLAVR